MANSLAAALKYLNTKLDKEYKAAAKSSGMDVNPAWVRPADVAGTFYLPKLSMPGLGNVTGGVFPAGDVTQTWVAYTYDYDRGRKIEIDTVAKDEAGQVAEIAVAAAEYMRMHVVPEIDAVRFAKVATAAHTTVEATISTSAEAIAATNLALVTLSNHEADMDNLLFYATAEVLDLLDSAAVSEKKARILSRATVVEVPQSRFQTEITVDAGATGSAGGFTLTGDEINFILMDKGAAFADAKHVAERFFPAGVNQGGDLARWDYRVVHDCWAFDNKKTGIYAHTTGAVS